MTCCGLKCETPFCPQCGLRIRENHPLDSLFQHILINVATMERNLKDAEEWHSEKGDGERRVRLATKALAKWNGWKEALQPIVIESSETD